MANPFDITIKQLPREIVEVPRGFARGIGRIGKDIFKRVRKQPFIQGFFTDPRKPFQKGTSESQRAKTDFGYSAGLALGALPIAGAATKIPKIIKPKAFSIVAASKGFLKPVETRIAQQGVSGQKLKTLITKAFDVGEVQAGKRIAELFKVNLKKLTKPERINLLDTMEGRAQPLNEKMKTVFNVARKITDELAGEAKRIGVQVKEKTTLRGTEFVKGTKELPTGLTPFQRGQLEQGKNVFATLKRPFEARQNYFPHKIPDVETLAKGEIRQDIIDNLVRLKIKPNAKEAAQFLEDYRTFIETGKRQDSLIDYMVQTGQSDNAAEAFANLQRFRQRTIKKQGSLEFARQVDLPFYDPDPARVLPEFTVSQSMRLSQIETFGQQNQEINKLIKQIRDEGGDADTVRTGVDRILGIINQNPIKTKASQFLRTIQGFKLGLASIPNMTQGVLNSLLLGDLRAAAAGLKGLFTRSGREFALRAGATLESTIQETMRGMGSRNELLGKFLKATGFTATERFNRITAANAGRSYGTRLAQQVIKNPTSKAGKILSELGVDVSELVKRGFLTDNEVLIMAKKFTDMTQFRARPQDLPLFASSSEGKVFFQFKNFIYGQTRLVHRSLIGELKAGRYGKATRNLFILATVFPLAGEVVADIRSLVTGRKRRTKGLARYFENIGQTGAMGIFFDTLQSGAFGRGTGFLAGPTVGEFGELIDILGGPKKGRNLAKFISRRVPFIGQIATPRLFRSKKKTKPISSPFNF